MKYLFIIIGLLLCGCSDRIVDNPGDATQVIIINDPHVVPGCPPDDEVMGECKGFITTDGRYIYIKHLYRMDANPAESDHYSAAMDATFKHECCHLTDLCGGDVAAMRARMPHLSLSWRHQIDWLISERKGNEDLWLTFQREYACDVIRHNDIKLRLGVK